jgi:hypothetical protein
VDLKITESCVEIYLGSERVSTHPKYPDYVTNRYSTHAEDMPDKFQGQEWSEARIENWAESIGSNAAEVVRRIFAAVTVKEQGYNPSLSVLRLGKHYTDTRLEVACELALTTIKSPRYHHIKAILASNQDIVHADRKARPPQKSSGTAVGYVRGAGYYGGGRDAE